MISLHGITSISTVLHHQCHFLHTQHGSAGNPRYQQKNKDSYLKLKSIVNHGRSSNLTYLVLGLFMMLTKSHTKYREYRSLILQHVGLSSEFIARDQNYFSRLRLAIFINGSEFSFKFLELLHSYGVTAKSTTMKNPHTNPKGFQLLYSRNGITYQSL
jgi:hypothetical protein